MNTKLTLSLNKRVIEAAKVYAKQSGRSLSEIIENYLRKLTYQPENLNASVVEDFEELYGCMDLRSKYDEKEAIRDIMSKKHAK